MKLVFCIIRIGFGCATSVFCYKLRKQVRMNTLGDTSSSVDQSDSQKVNVGFGKHVINAQVGGFAYECQNYQLCDNRINSFFN